MSTRGNRERNEGKRCSLMPGEAFTSRAEADEMRVTRQMNVARGGMGQVNYAVKACNCNRWHVMTDTHLREWELARRVARRERRRNA